MRIKECPEWGAWVTPRLLRQRPIYRWYVYPHSYDKELVLALLERLQVSQGAWVWDPFVGAGTTLLACREYGCSALGTDLLPLSVLVTKAKFIQYDPELLADQLEDFSFELPAGVVDRFAPIPIVGKALSAKRRRQISHVLDQIDRLPRASKLFFRVALLRTMEELAIAVKSGGWLRIDPDRDVEGKSLRNLFRRHAKAMLNDLMTQTSSRFGKSILQVEIGDARTVKPEQLVSACITSPPYLNRHDYTRVFALELALVGVSSSKELTSLRYRTLRSHIEARPPDKANLDAIFIPHIVSSIVRKIESTGTNNPRIPAMVAGYFEDMALVMKNIARNLRPGGSVAFVIGNTRFSGIMIPVDEILMKMGPATGLEPEQIIVARHRGNSAQQMGVYGREPARESVVILKKPK